MNASPLPLTRPSALRWLRPRAWLAVLVAAGLAVAAAVSVSATQEPAGWADPTVRALSGHPDPHDRAIMRDALMRPGMPSVFRHADPSVRP